MDAVRTHSIMSALTNPRVLAFTVIFAGIGMSGVGLVLFLPQILKSLGLTNIWKAGLLTLGALRLLARWRSTGFGYLSDRIGDRFWILTGTCACGAVGMAIGGVLHDSLWVLAAFSLATFSFYTE